MRSDKKLDKQSLHYDTKGLFEPITKIVYRTSKKLTEESKFTTAACENLIKS